jgi:Arc/MetJ-type ribon-helix-helix transcriptional regulator
MSQIAVRLSEDELRRLDAAVLDGSFRTRAEAVRAAIAMLEQATREARIEASYRAAYAAAPLSDDESRALDGASALAGEALA